LWEVDMAVHNRIFQIWMGERAPGSCREMINFSSVHDMENAQF
jgi:hypothetical protein